MRPDLVIRKDERIMILDVTIRFERGPGTLAQAYKEKVENYRPLAQVLGQS